MFGEAGNKLGNAQVHFEALKRASNSPETVAEFNAFVSSIRAIAPLIKKFGPKGNPEFDRWCEAKFAEQTTDPLLRCLKEVREQDFHEGKIRAGHAVTFNRPFTISGSGFTLGADGRITTRDGSSFQIPKEVADIVPVLLDAPKEHLGKPINTPNLISICQFGLDYYTAVLEEARHKFGGLQ